MSADGYSYLDQELRGHVQHLSGVSDQLDVVARQDMGAPPNAFGLIGSFIPGLLQPMVSKAESVTAASRDSVRETSHMMRHTLDDYDRSDEDSASAFRSEEQAL